MANCPNGFWECPNCGDFVEDTLHICHNCRYDKNTEKQAAQTRTKTSYSYTSSSNGEIRSMKGLNEKMFGNVGKSIKTLAKIFCWIGIVASMIGAIALVFIGIPEIRWGGGMYIAIGIGVLILGPVLSWFGSLHTYAFGDLVENTAENKRLLAKADAERNSDK